MAQPEGAEPVAPPDPPSGDRPPANAVPAGQVLLREPFDKPTDQTPEVSNGQQKARFVGGVYEDRWLANGERPGGERPGGMFSVFGTPCEHTAFALHVRAYTAGYTTSFRSIGDAARWTRLRFGVRPDGTWDLVREGVKVRGEGTELEPAVVLKESAAPDPELKEGKWVTLAVRSAGATTEVWVNGRPLTTVTEAEVPPGALVTGQGAVVFCTVMPDKGACGFDLDYLVIWKLPAPAGGLGPKK